MKQRVPQEIRDHWQRVVNLGCLVCKSSLVSLHHAHSRALTALGLGRGMGQKTNDWLVIPLCPHHHYGDEGVDVIGVKSWEARYGGQVEMLGAVSLALGYDCIARARGEGGSLQSGVG